MKGVAFMADRLSWNEIREKYPHMQVGLSNIIWVNNDNTNVESAVVSCTDQEMSLDEMADQIFAGTIQAIAYTTPEDDVSVGALMGE